MDLEAGIAILDTLMFAIEQSVVLQDKNALILVTEFFRMVFAEGKDFALQVLEHLITFFVE